MISSDKEKVAEILNELLENANKFTQQGLIVLTCSQPDGQNVTFTVSDTGIGISEADRPLIFSQFMKVDYFTDGVGLGLSLCQRTARLLGGDLMLDPAYTSGASFILRLPLNESTDQTS
jgi:signal transduction histidine kinase